MLHNLTDIFREADEQKIRELDYLGYTKIGKIGAVQLAELRRETKHFLASLKGKLPPDILFNLINSDAHTKAVSNAISEKYLVPKLMQVLNPDRVDMYPVSHLVKPFGRHSSIWHQDCAIVDERIDYSLNVWMPLVNSHRLNGCLWIFPGSHLSENFARQFGYNPIEGEVLAELKKYMKPIRVEAGEIIVFHRNIIHGSSNNWLPMDRIAMEAVAVPKGAQLYNFHRDENLLKDKVLGYRVRREHFLKEVPKEDFYDGTYAYEAFDDEGFEGTQKYLLDHIPDFVAHAKKYAYEYAG